MPYLHFIETKLDSKGDQIKGLDVPSQMHIIVKIFDIIKCLKNKKNKKIKKKEREQGKWPKKAQIFFHSINPHNKTKK